MFANVDHMLVSHNFLLFQTKKHHLFWVVTDPRGNSVLIVSLQSGQRLFMW